MDVELTEHGCRTRLANGDVLQSKFVIGADGARSRVRELCRIPFEITRPPIVWAVIDGVIDLTDTLYVLSHFGRLPGDQDYSNLVDREALYPEMRWRPFPANGLNLGIDLQDALISLESFGHTCL